MTSRKGRLERREEAEMRPRSLGRSGVIVSLMVATTLGLSGCAAPMVAGAAMAGYSGLVVGEAVDQAVEGQDEGDKSDDGYNWKWSDGSDESWSAGW